MAASAAVVTDSGAAAGGSVPARCRTPAGRSTSGIGRCESGHGINNPGGRFGRIPVASHSSARKRVACGAAALVPFIRTRRTGTRAGSKDSAQHVGLLAELQPVGALRRSHGSRPRAMRRIPCRVAIRKSVPANDPCVPTGCDPAQRSQTLHVTVRCRVVVQRTAIRTRIAGSSDHRSTTGDPWHDGPTKYRIA